MQSRGTIVAARYGEIKKSTILLPSEAVGRNQTNEGSGFGVQDLGATTGSEVLNPEP